MLGAADLLYIPKVPMFRKGLRGQEKLCLFQPLRNGGAAGKFTAAGLPDLEGEMYAGTYNDYTTSGAFYTQGIPHLRNTLSEGSTFGGEFFYFKASRYNTIFGSCNTVIPSSADAVIGLYLGYTA